MSSQVTSGIRVSVESFYQKKFSNPSSGDHVYAYRIKIENKSDQPVRLLDRRWIIFDSLTGIREVKGKGVIGEQPCINPDGFYQYVSGCHFTSEIGGMKGSYTMQNTESGEYFDVEIPEFHLIAPARLN